MKDLLNDELLETLTQMRGRKFPLNDPDTGKTLFIMKKLILLVPLIANFSAAPPAYPIELTDFFSDVFWNAGYVYSPENPLGFNAGLFGFDISCSLPIENEEAGAGKKYKSEFAQASLTYGIKIFDWLRVPVGVSVYNDAVNKSADENISNPGKIGFNIGAEIIANPFSDNWKLSIKAQTINFSHFLFGAGIVYVFSDSPKPAPRPRPAPTPPPAPPPAPQPARYPTLTPEELRRVELAYEETVRDLERQGRRLYIRNPSERAAFIRQYQGRPDTASVSRARNVRLPYYSARETSEQAIVSLARRETDPFLRVRMIHDWVSDVFAYDYDLLWWMDNVSHRNEEFTLRAIVQRQRGVCLEYAILFCYLMNAAGVDAYLVSDHSEPGIGHAYNMVVINGTGYIIDTTWDSGNRYVNGKIRQFDRMVLKDYFMPGISQSYRLRGW